MRLFQEVDDLFQLFFGLVASRDFHERNLLLVAVEHFGLALAKHHGLVAASLHLSDKKEPEHYKKSERNKPGEHLKHKITGGAVLHFNFAYIPLKHLGNEAIVKHDGGGEPANLSSRIKPLLLLEFPFDFGGGNFQRLNEILLGVKHHVTE